MAVRTQGYRPPLLDGGAALAASPESRRALAPGAGLPPSTFTVPTMTEQGSDHRTTS
jgi:hypothetical protein